MRRADPRRGILGLLVATSLGLVALILFARNPAKFRTGSDYSAVFRSVAGLNPGNDVRYGGLLVGTVTKLEIDSTNPTRIVARFRVRRGTPVRTDTRASVAQVGLLGEPYLHLQPGAANAPPLAAGSRVASVDNATFQEAMARLATFFDRADTLISGVERLARGSPMERAERLVARMDQVMSRVDTLVVAATAGSGRTFATIDTTTARLGRLIERSDRLVSVLDTTVRTAAPGLQSTQEEALRTARELRLLLADLRQAMQQEGGVDQMVRNLAVTSDNLARLSDRLERDPASVMRRRATPAKPVGPAVRD